MQHGVLSGSGNDVRWNLVLRDRLLEIGALTAAEHTETAFIIEADYCTDCKKMIFGTDING